MEHAAFFLFGLFVGLFVSMVVIGVCQTSGRSEDA